MNILLIPFFTVSSLLAMAQAPIQNFTLTNVANGAAVSLESYSSSAGVVIIFTSSNCPYDHYYADRLKNLINAYESKVQFLFINSHPDPEETIEKMKITSVAWGSSVPYLSDKDQIAMDCLGAKRSPEVYVLKNVKGKFYMSYGGAIDDNPQEQTAVTVQYLKGAIDAFLSGQAIDRPTVRAVGCSMQRK